MDTQKKSRTNPVTLTESEFKPDDTMFLTWGTFLSTKRLKLYSGDLFERSELSEGGSTSGRSISWIFRWEAVTDLVYVSTKGV